MDEMQIKKFVAQKLHEGIKLTEIQTMLVNELDCKMTFLELRLLASELEDVDWSQFDPRENKPTEAAPAAPAENIPAEGDMADDLEPAPAAAEGAAGATTVELSRDFKRGSRGGRCTFTDLEMQKIALAEAADAGNQRKIAIRRAEDDIFVLEGIAYFLLYQRNIFVEIHFYLFSLYKKKYKRNSYD